ncbi:Protein of unknown function [Rhizobiales bacterium GAS191]|nr:Protein of unknown function [Rhizobiales bacterium GAS113]SEC17745.1 Protein of unknown function [Rhizobiales bacterium GAS191]
MLTTFLGFQAINRNLTKSLASTAAEPAVAVQTKYYLANIGKVKSIDDFIKNDRLFNYAMKAYGLGDMTYAKGLMRKVLQGGITDPKSLANKLTDPRYLAFVTAFNFAIHGAETTKLAQATSVTVSKFTQQTLEDEAGAQQPGVRLALYFERMAPTLKSAYGILADKALLSVVQTTLGIPAASSAQNIDLQATNISSKLNVKDFQDPAKLQKFIQRFTAVYDSQNSPAETTVSTLFGGSGGFGLNADLLFSLQNIKLGG